MMKTYILYHDNCYDGFGAAVAAYLFLRQEDPFAVFLPVNYGRPVPPIEEGSDVFILDFSYPAEILAQLSKSMFRVTVLDHHATAEKDLNFENFHKMGLTDNSYEIRRGPFFLPRKNLQIRFDMSKSGAMLAWEHFFTSPAPLLFQYLQDRDLWRWEMPDSRQVNAFLQTLPLDFDDWARLANDLQNPDILRDAVSAGVACLRMKNQMVSMMAEHHRTMLFDMNTNPPSITPTEATECGENQYLVPVTNATVFFSEVGEFLLNCTDVRARFSAYYFDRDDGKRQWGLRSRENFDCSKIAKAFGGGGHKQSSGFTQPIPWVVNPLP